MYEKKVREMARLQVDEQMNQKQGEIDFFESMIKELEEQLKIEIRKKAIMKNQCD